MDLHEIKELVWQGLTKWFFFIIWIVLSFIGKISAMLLYNKPITWRLLVGEAGSTLFFGAMAYACCKYTGQSDAGTAIIVPSVCYISGKLAILTLQKYSLRKIIVRLLTDFTEYVKKW